MRRHASYLGSYEKSRDPSRRVAPAPSPPPGSFVCPAAGPYACECQACQEAPDREEAKSKLVRPIAVGCTFTRLVERCFAVARKRDIESKQMRSEISDSARSGGP